MKKEAEINFSNLNVITGNIYRYEAPTDWRSHTRHKTQNELIYIIEGECLLSVNDFNYMMREGQMALLPKGKSYFHSLTSKRKLTYYQCHFAAETEKTDIFQFLGLSDNDYVVEVKDRIEMERLFEDSIHDQTFENNIAVKMNKCSQVIKILAKYIDLRFSMMPDKRTEAFKDVTEYMKNNLGNNIGVSSLAAMVHMQASYFNRKFTQVFGIPPMKYYDRLRAQKAMALITKTSMTIAEIGRFIGIDDKYYFSRFFKKHCGISPEEFMKLTRLQ